MCVCVCVCVFLHTGSSYMIMKLLPLATPYCVSRGHNRLCTETKKIYIYPTHDNTSHLRLSFPGDKEGHRAVKMATNKYQPERTATR